ncbi:MAG: EamA family transporter [Candidatus Omnitrophota bacterium]
MRFYKFSLYRAQSLHIYIHASRASHDNLKQYFFHFGFYFTSSLIWLMVLSRAELSYAYPMLSLGYIMIVFLSWIIFKENVSFWRWLGIILISFGVGLLQK